MPRGGTRPSAGRKAKNQKNVSHTVSLKKKTPCVVQVSLEPPELLAWVDATRGKQSREEFIRTVLHEAFEKSRNQKRQQQVMTELAQRGGAQVHLARNVDTLEQAYGRKP